MVHHLVRVDVTKVRVVSDADRGLGELLEELEEALLRADVGVATTDRLLTPRRRGRRFSLWHLILMPTALIFLIPFVQMFLAALSPAEDLQKFPPPFVPYPGKGGAPIKVPKHGILAKDRVRYVGEPVAAVVALPLVLPPTVLGFYLLLLMGLVSGTYLGFKPKEKP